MCNLKNSAVYSSCECLLSRDTGNSDIQNAILETTENTSTWEIEVRKQFSIFKVWSQATYVYF